MLIVIRNVLKPEELTEILGHLSAGSFVDGKLTAGGRAKRVKENLQLERGTEGSKQLEDMVLNALRRNAAFQSAVMPARIYPPLFSRYDEDMQYGTHFDNAFMGTGAGVVRTDAAVTLFLSDPESYQGGELVVEMNAGQRVIKLDRGDAVVYESDRMHRVNPVKGGVRLAAVTWVQSLVRDPGQREVLHDLNVVRQWLLRGHPDAKEGALLGRACSKLMRMWAEL